MSWDTPIRNNDDDDDSDNFIAPSQLPHRSQELPSSVGLLPDQMGHLFLPPQQQQQWQQQQQQQQQRQQQQQQQQEVQRHEPPRSETVTALDEPDLVRFWVDFKTMFYAKEVLPNTRLVISLRFICDDRRFTNVLFLMFSTRHNDQIPFPPSQKMRNVYSETMLHAKADPNDRHITHFNAVIKNPHRLPFVAKLVEVAVHCRDISNYGYLRNIMMPWPNDLHLRRFLDSLHPRVFKQKIDLLLLNIDIVWRPGQDRDKEIVDWAAYMANYMSVIFFTDQRRFNMPRNMHPPMVKTIKTCTQFSKDVAAHIQESWTGFTGMLHTYEEDNPFFRANVYDHEIYVQARDPTTVEIIHLDNDAQKKTCDIM